MSKKIAMLIKDRQEEGLRMSVGITLMDDVIDVYVLDREVEKTDKNILSLETIKDMEMKIYTNYSGNGGIAFLSGKEIAERLLGYDHIISY